MRPRRRSPRRLALARAHTRTSSGRCRPAWTTEPATSDSRIPSFSSTTTTSFSTETTRTSATTRTPAASKRRRAGISASESTSDASGRDAVADEGHVVTVLREALRDAASFSVPFFVQDDHRRVDLRAGQDVDRRERGREPRLRAPIPLRLRPRPAPDRAPLPRLRRLRARLRTASRTSWRTRHSMRC